MGLARRFVAQLKGGRVAIALVAQQRACRQEHRGLEFRCAVDLVSLIVVEQFGNTQCLAPHAMHDHAAETQ